MAEFDCCGIPEPEAPFAKEEIKQSQAIISTCSLQSREEI